MKRIDVFRSSKKADTYLYVESGTDFEALPDPLKKVFGRPEPALSLMLTPEKQLARYTGEHVLSVIEEQGFFLQLPPEPGAAEPC